MLIANQMIAANEIGGMQGNNKSIEKYEKLSKSQKLAKSKKKLSKSRNRSNFNAKKNKLSFLTSHAGITFNHL